MEPAELVLRRYAAQGLVAEAGRMALDYFGQGNRRLPGI